jgi:hypothetical protein
LRQRRHRNDRADETKHRLIDKKAPEHSGAKAAQHNQHIASISTLSRSFARSAVRALAREQKISQIP